MRGLHVRVCRCGLVTVALTGQMLRDAAPTCYHPLPNPEIKLDASVFSSEKRLTLNKVWTSVPDSAPVTILKC